MDNIIIPPFESNFEDLYKNTTIDGVTVVNNIKKLVKNIIVNAGSVADIIQQYNNWLYIRLPEQLRNTWFILNNKYDNDNDRYKLRFNIKDDTYIEKPIDENGKPLLPVTARRNKLKYVSKIYADIEMYKPLINKMDQTVIRDESGNIKYDEIQPENKITREHIFSLATMVRARNCYLFNKTDDERLKMGTCYSDPGGYFIINGNPYVVVGQEQLATNKALLIFDKNTEQVVLRYISKHQLGSNLLNIKLYKNIIQLYLNINYNLDTKELPGINIFLIYQLYYPDMTIDEAYNHILSFIPKQYVNKLSNILDYTYLDYIKKNENVYDVVYGIMKQDSKSVKKQSKSQYIDNKDSYNNDMIFKMINSKFLPDNTKISNKINMFAILVVKYLTYLGNYIGIDNRDDWNNKKIVSASGNLEKIVIPSFKHLINLNISSNNNIKKGNMRNKNLNSILSMLGLNKITEILNNHFIRIFITSGKGRGWGIYKEKGTENISQLLNTDNLVAQLSHLYRTIISGSYKSKNMTSREVEPSQLMFFDPNQTPESDQLGLVKYRTIFCRYSDYIDPILIIEWLNNNNLIVDIKNEQNTDSVIVEGLFSGYCHGPTLYNIIKTVLKRYRGMEFVSVVYDSINNIIYILTDAGRPMTPLFIINQETDELVINELSKDDNNIWNNNIYELIEKGAIEYVCPWEVSNLLIAMSEKYIKIRKNEYIELLNDISYNESLLMTIDDDNINNIITIKNKLIRLNLTKNKFRKYTYSMIHGLNIMGIASSLLPLAANNQGPRISYGCNHLTQAMSLGDMLLSNLSTLTRVGITMETPVVKTITYDAYGIDKLPGGKNLIIAIMTYGGYNMEDGIIASKMAMDLGALLYNTYKTIIIETSTNYGNIRVMERVGSPIRTKTLKDNYNPYANLGDNGIIKIGSRVQDGDCLVGIVRNYVNSDKKEDASYYSKLDENGIVDDIVDNINPTTGMGKIIIRLRNTRSVEIGDKIADRHAQKTTITKILSLEDMPYFEDGSYPALIFSPWAIPSRMTMGKLWETIMAMYGILIGESVDATSFEEYNFDKMMSYLKLYGFDPYGRRKMYDPITGKELETLVFSGPNYYQMLRHLVHLKKQSTRGENRDSVTRQVTRGRNVYKGGGLRIGEMESDTLYGHGVFAVKQAIYGQSDLMSMVYCSECGNPATKGDRDYIYSCHICEQNKNFKKISTPASTNILKTMLGGANILMNFKIDGSVIKDSIDSTL